MPPKYVSTFRAPTEYERQLEEARRRAMLAEALAQQQYEPTEGNAAPIPKAAPLVKALQGFMTARAGRQAKEAEETAKGMEADYAQRMLGRMEGGYVYDPTAPARAPIPEQTQLEEVTRQSRYKKSPEEALAMASTSLGTAALKDRPIMAARLAKMLETPEGEEFYAPTETAEGFVQFGKRGGRKDTGVAAPTKAPEPTTTQKDYEFARSQGYTGSFEDFRRASAPVTNIDLGLKDTFKLEADLRGEVKDKLKNYEAVRDSYQKIENALKTGAGDIAVVYAFAKLNDPTSVVRESEFETVAKSGSLGQRIKNLVEQAQTGKMNPELRENLRQQARQMYLAQQGQAEQVANQYRDLAQTYNLDPRKVLAGISIDNLAAQPEKDVIELPPRRRR
jgi:hypothetical protein